MEKKELLDIQNIDQKVMYFFRKKALLDAFESRRVCSANNDMAKEIETLRKQFLLLVQEQASILSFIEKYSDAMDQEEVNLFLTDFFSFSSEFLEYYETQLANLGKKEKQEKKVFLFSDYWIHARCLLLKMKDIMDYLHYPIDFWEYIMPRISLRDSHIPEHRFFYLVNIKVDTEDNIVDMHVGVPAIVNLETALVNIHEFRHAYDLYQLLGHPLPKEEEEYEKDAREEEKKFIKKYISSIEPL